MTLDTPCASCGAILAPWERGRCSCEAPRYQTIREVLYCIACASSGPIHARDFVRNAERDHGVWLNEATAIASLSPDRRFCWAGRGTYALYRHGPLPGPRSLVEAARIVLVAAGRPLADDALDFCLKQLGYRYHVASLLNACGWSGVIQRREGRWDHPRGEDAERHLRQSIPMVPPPTIAANGVHRDAWARFLAGVQLRVQEVLAEREARFTALADPSRFGIEWQPDVD